MFFLFIFFERVFNLFFPPLAIAAQTDSRWNSRKGTFKGFRVDLVLTKVNCYEIRCIRRWAGQAETRTSIGENGRAAIKLEGMLPRCVSSKPVVAPLSSRTRRIVPSNLRIFDGASLGHTERREKDRVGEKNRREKKGILTYLAKVSPTCNDVTHRKSTNDLKMNEI